MVAAGTRSTSATGTGLLGGSIPAGRCLQRLLVAGFGVLLFWFLAPLLVDGLDEVDGGAELILAALLAAPMVIAVGGLVLAVRAALDLFSTNEVIGEIVRLRLRLRRSDDSIEYFVAVDDGRSQTVRAWAVRPDVYTGLEQGDVVTARVTPRLGYVHSIQRASA